MLAGGIGSGAINVLGSYGIRVVRGCEGVALDVVTQFALGNIVDSGSSCQQHDHHHHHDRACNH